MTWAAVIRKLKAAGFVEVRSGKGPIVLEIKESGAVSGYVPGLPV